MSITEENDKYASLSLENLLADLSAKAVELNPDGFETTREHWIGFENALEADILAAENRLAITLPSDYKTFLGITNGFPAVNDIATSFLPISKIDYAKNIVPDLIKVYGTNGLKKNQINPEKYDRSILIGGLDEEQMFLLIPPKNGDTKWEYWKFANWIPGEEVYVSLRAYLESSLDFCIYIRG